MSLSPDTLDDALAGLLEDVDADAQERDALEAEVRRFLFGRRGRPLLTLDMKLSAMVWIWQHYTEKVDAWVAGWRQRSADLHRELAGLGRGKVFLGRRRLLKEAITDAEWRRGCARHALYQDFQFRQFDLRQVLVECWEESDVPPNEADSRLEIWGEILASRYYYSRYYYERFYNHTLREIAAHIAAHEE